MSDFLRSLAACLLVAAGWAAEPVDQAAHALEELRSANAARSAQASEWQAWQVESERSYALLDGVQSQVARLRAEAAAARDTAARLRQEAEAAGETRRQLVRLDGVFAAQADAVTAALAKARAASVPGAVPTPAEGGDARARFAAAMRALESAEHAATTCVVEVVEGEIEAGEARAVTMLRIAGFGWWCEIDGPRAGRVEPRATGGPLLIAADASAADAIRRAIAIAQGARPPELLLLPVHSSAIIAAPPTGATK